MLFQKSVLKIDKGDRNYSFTCEPNSPLGEIHDVLSDMKAYVVKVLKEVYEKEATAEKKPDPAVEVKPEVAPEPAPQAVIPEIVQ